MPTADTTLFAARKAPRTSLKAARNGETKFATCNHDWMGTGYNSALKSGQTTRITFAAPGTIAPGAQVWLTVSLPDCSTVMIDLHNCNDAGGSTQVLADLLLAKINGVAPVGAIAYSQISLPGFTAVKPTTPANSVDITGTAGCKFSIVATGFGVTINGILNPPVPTISTTVSAIAAGKIPYGVAVVANPVANDIAWASVRNESIAKEVSSILSLPTGNTNEEFRGITIRDNNETIPFSGSGDCCDPKDCSEGWDCHSCLHYVNTCCHTQQIAVQLEPFPAGAVIPPGGWVNTPVFYRITAKTGYPQLGALSIFPTVGDLTVVAARNAATSQEFVIKEVIDPATNQVFIGLRGV